MSIIKLKPSDVESFTIATTPSRFYASSSLGVTGSVNVFARRSKIEKEIAPLSSFVEATHDDADLSSQLDSVKKTLSEIKNVKQDKSGFEAINAYMENVNAQGVSARKQKALDILRVTPTDAFSSDTLRKLVIKDVLMPHYRVSFPSAQWTYTNYNSLNFFTASSVRNDAALLYPNVYGYYETKYDNYYDGKYALLDEFSFDFYINPRYTCDEPNGVFHAGTIFHLSSSYAVSLVSGSLRDHNGKTKGFRIQLQLSHSADIKPSVANPGVFPNDLVFLSDDNSLLHNNWHHVVIRWGTTNINEGTGSFNIDGEDKGFFVIPSLSTRLYPPVLDQNPEVLCVGNYYEGVNSGSSKLSNFFGTFPSYRDGLINIDGSSVILDEPTSYDFTHPLNAEVHDLSIKRYYMDDLDISFSSSKSPDALDDRVVFYLPPFFTEESPTRRYVQGHGGVLNTPTLEVDGTTSDPFNVAMSFGTSGHYLNLENFTKDFANNIFPRLHQLTGTTVATSTDVVSSNDVIYSDPRNRRRNLTVLPCDDGNFSPSYQLLANETKKTKMRGDDGVEDLSVVNLDSLLSTSSYLFGSENDKFVNSMIGFTPEQPLNLLGPAYEAYIKKVLAALNDGTYSSETSKLAPLCVAQRTRDLSSNEIVIFDVSNLFYGNRIHPTTLTILDTSITGSNGKIGITLKDDGLGNIYRADCDSTPATWNNVGNVFYDEGLIIIKNPLIPLFGKDQFEISFKGEQNVHSMKFDIVAPENMINSSSNPCYKDVPFSNNVADIDPSFVYITSINFHDEDFNVVARSVLAQPIMKRNNARIMFKVRLDV